MRKYKIELRKIFVGTVEVEAKDLYEAYDKVEMMDDFDKIECSELESTAVSGISIDNEKKMDAIRLENTGLKDFSSEFAKNDRTIPYTFYLNYGIRSEAQLLVSIQRNRDCSTREDDIESVAAEYGYSRIYLEEKFPILNLHELKKT